MTQASNAADVSAGSGVTEVVLSMGPHLLGIMQTSTSAAVVAGVGRPGQVMMEVVVVPTEVRGTAAAVAARRAVAVALIFILTSLDRSTEDDGFYQGSGGRVPTSESLVSMSLDEGGIRTEHREKETG